MGCMMGKALGQGPGTLPYTKRVPTLVLQLSALILEKGELFSLISGTGSTPQIIGMNKCKKNGYHEAPWMVSWYY